MSFKKAKWIWINTEDNPDEYGEFYKEFIASKNEKVICRLSCDGDYTLFVNGKYAASNQYGDFTHYKIYDEIDISDLLSDGKNAVSIIVWHVGINTSRYKKEAPGIIFELTSGESTVAASDKTTLARISKCYESHRCKLITAQLGYGYHYDSRFDDGSLFSGIGFGSAEEISKDTVFYPRPNEKLRLKSPKMPINTSAVEGGCHFIFDLGEETVGLLSLNFKTEKEQKIRVAWGEHLTDGHVAEIIGSRCFSIDYTAKAGVNEYTNYMLRLGCRYLEVFAEEPITPDYIGIIPQHYPTERIPARLDDGLDQRIYDLCVNTLELSMMEHYVDCPWREQALYAFDSRNQMLSGYYAFENMNADYALSNLRLISMDKRNTPLLSICFPTGREMDIPSFSLHYFLSVWEYYEHTGNAAFLEEVYPRLTEIIEAFAANIKDGLIYAFSGKEHWNFYDWSDYLDGSIGRGGEGECDAIINLLFVIALDNFEKTSSALGKEFKLGDIKKAIKENIKTTFFNKKDGLYSFNIGKNNYTELANALAIIAGVAEGEVAEKICKKLLGKEVSECSLSLKCFTYDALILTDPEKHKDYVLDEIRKNYGYMLDNGATAAWETIKGASDFDGAGSLCHGWSAIPVYYYHKFGMVK